MTVGTTTVYETCRTTLMTFQLLSFAEVMHAAMGVTKSPTSAALMQWAGRAHCLKCVGLGEIVARDTGGDGVDFSVGNDGGDSVSVVRRITRGREPEVVDVAAVHGVRAAVSAGEWGGDEADVRRAGLRAENENVRHRDAECV